MAEGLQGGEQDVIVQDPWRQLGRRYKSLERDKTLPEVTVTRPGPDTEGFYNRLKRTLDISSAANRVQETKTQNLIEKRALEEAEFLKNQWGSIDLSGVSPEFLAQQGLTYEDILKGGGAGRPAGMPLSGNVRTTSGFGRRSGSNVSSGRISSSHTGMDFGAPAGTPIYATHSGTVNKSGWSGNYGNLVTINGSSGLSTYYAHQSRTAVKPGQQVVKGQIIGYVGSTGRSTGNHLHYEVRVNGRPVNPSAYF